MTNEHLDALKASVEALKSEADKMSAIIAQYEEPETPPPPPPPPPPFPPNSYFVDSANGSDTNDGKSAAMAWKTWSKAAAFTFPASSHLFLKSGSLFTGSMIVPANVTVDIYGGTTKVTFSGLRDIKGTTADWTQEASNPNAWTRTVPASIQSRDWAIVNGRGMFGGKVGPATAVNAPGKYSRLSGTTICIYSVGNPATVYDTIENIIDAGNGLQFKAAGGTVRNIIFKGFRTGIWLTTPNNTVEDCEIWFTTNGGLVLSSGGNVVRRTPGYLTGTTVGGHGIYIAIPRIGTNPITAINHIYDSPNYGSGEDNFQQNGGGGADTPADNITTHLIATKPKSMWLWKSLENAIDVKRGLLVLEGPGMASCGPLQQATVTTQAICRGVVNRGWSLRHAGNGVAIQNQEQNHNKFDSQKSFYYSETNVPWFGVYNGQDHTSAFDIFWSPKSSATGLTSGSFTATHSTFLCGYSGINPQIRSSAATLFASITHDGVDAGQGNYTATLAETNVRGSVFGTGVKIRITGLTGESAAYNGLHLLTATGLATGKYTFKVPIASNPPATATLTGLTITVFATLGALKNNLVFGGNRALFIQGADCLPISLGGSTFIGAPFDGGLAAYGSKFYTAAQVTSDAAVAGNLKFDTGGKAGGSTWRASVTPISNCFEYDTAATISVTDKVATVTSSVIKPTAVGQPVGITASGDVSLHGIHFVKSIGTGSFTFNMEYDSPDVASRTCTATQFKPKATSPAHGSAPVVDAGSITTDVLGNPMPASGRNFGAVQG